MPGIIAPGRDQDLVDTVSEVNTSTKKNKKRKPRRPDFDVGLDGHCREFGGRVRTQHTPCGKPARSVARGPVAMY